MKASKDVVLDNQDTRELARDLYALADRLEGLLRTRSARASEARVGFSGPHADTFGARLAQEAAHGHALAGALRSDAAPVRHRLEEGDGRPEPGDLRPARRAGEEATLGPDHHLGRPVRLPVPPEPDPVPASPDGDVFSHDRACPASWSSGCRPAEFRSGSPMTPAAAWCRIRRQAGGSAGGSPTATTPGGSWSPGGGRAATSRWEALSGASVATQTAVRMGVNAAGSAATQAVSGAPIRQAATH